MRKCTLYGRPLHVYGWRNFTAELKRAITTSIAVATFITAAFVAIAASIKAASVCAVASAAAATGFRRSH